MKFPGGNWSNLKRCPEGFIGERGRIAWIAAEPEKRGVAAINLSSMKSAAPMQQPMGVQFSVAEARLIVLENLLKIPLLQFTYQKFFKNYQIKMYKMVVQFLRFPHNNGTENFRNAGQTLLIFVIIYDNIAPTSAALKRALKTSPLI